MAERRKRRDRKTRQSTSNDRPFGSIKLPYKPLEILNEEQIQDIHDASMNILENTGMEVLDQRTLTLLKEAGAKVNGAIVCFDREMITSLIKTAPSQFSIYGRNPKKKITIGDGHSIFSSVGGPPFVSDMDRGRRDGTYQDMCDFLKLVQSYDILHMEGGIPMEPSDIPAATRHLDLYLAQCRLLDKPWQPQMLGTENALDALHMAAISRGESIDDLADRPAFLAVTNTNTPLVFDAPITQAIIELSSAGQAVCVTPFPLAGSMAPITLAGALALQNAEALVGVALTQIIHPGAPACYGTFTTNVDMRSGAPVFGTPAYSKAAIASGQMARHYNLPWRSSNTSTSCTVDAQAAYESQMSIWGAMMGGCNFLNHAAGWLEGGLVASFEKLVVDAEMLSMMASFAEPIEVSEEAFALDTVESVGQGGHYLSTSHTIKNYRNEYHQPEVSDWRIYDLWEKDGSKTTLERANTIWKDRLKNHIDPVLDQDKDEALSAYAAKRKEEIMKGA